MASRLSLLVCCLWLAVAAAPTTAQDKTPPAAQQPTFRAGIQSVRVDLYATRDDKPVTDLRLDEIQLFEDGDPQTIQTFERITYAGHSAVPPPDPRSSALGRDMATDPRSRLFVLFVPTRSSSPFGNRASPFANRTSPAPSPLVRDRFPVVPQLNGLLGDDDLIAVMTPSMRLADLEFQHRLSMNTTAWFADEQADPRTSLWDACYPPGIPGSPNFEMKARYQELLTFDALEALVTHLGGLREERKHVLVITSGFRLFTKNPNLGMQMRSGNGAPGIPTGGGPAPMGVIPRLGDAIGSPISPRQCEADLADLASLDNSNRLDELAEHARRHNVTFHPISQTPVTASRGRAPGQIVNRTAFEAQSSLRNLAEDTDGTFSNSANNVEGNLRKMLTTTSSYYLIGYTPSNTTADGKFRRITVKVNRSNTRVRARSGYFAVSPEEMRPAVEPTPVVKPPDPVYTAISAIALTRPGQLHIRPALWTRPGASPTGSLWVVAEIDEQSRARGEWSKGGSAELTLRPSGGGTAITRRVDIAADNPIVEFDLLSDTLAPGQYSMQLELAPNAGKPVGDFVRLTMPAEPTAFGEPVFSRRTSAPGRRFARTADARFRRNEFVRIEMPTSATSTATARLLDGKGGPLPVPAQVTTRADASGAFQWIVVDIPMTPLAPALYAVEVTQGDSSRITAFRVIP